MSLLFWALFVIEIICVIGYIVASINHNYRRSNMIECVAYLVAVLLLVIAVICNKGLISW